MFARSADSQPDGNLAAASDRTHQQKTGNVGAGQQEQNRRESQQHWNNLVEIAVDAEGRAPEGVERNLVRTIPVILREPLGDSPHEQVELCLCLILRDTRVKLSKHVQPENAAIGGTVRTPPNVTIHRERNPQVGAEAGFAAGEIPRGYTNNGVGMAIDLNHFADDLRITREMVLPDGVTEDDHCSPGTRRSFFRKKSAAQNRVHAENVKIIGGGQSPVNALGLRGAGERHVVVVIAEKSGKSLSALAEVTKVGIRKWRGGMIAAIAARDGDKVARVSDSGNRVQQGSAHPTEHSGIGGDAERQCKNDDGSKAWILPRHAEREATVSYQRVEPCSGPCISHQFLHLLNTSQLDVRCSFRFIWLHT